MTHRELRKIVVLLAALAAVGALVVSAVAPAAPVAIDLCAKEGTLSLPGGASVTVWGFAPGDCSNASVPAQVPGPVLDVAAGDEVTLRVHNALTRDVALDLPGLNVAEGSAVASPGGNATYTFTASDPGTYAYSSGSDAGRQVAMGLYGALIVRPATAGRAYDDAATAYDREKVLVLSEIDPALNATVDAEPDGYDSFNMNNWAPSYWLINGKAYSAASPDANEITAQPGDRVLLRYVSAGPETVTMTMLGTNARLVARDALPLRNPYDVVAETIPAGSTADEIATIPAGATPGSGFPLYNRQLHLTNGAFGSPEHSPGGMLTFMRVPGP